MFSAPFPAEEAWESRSAARGENHGLSQSHQLFPILVAGSQKPSRKPGPQFPRLHRPILSGLRLVLRRGPMLSPLPPSQGFRVPWQLLAAGRIWFTDLENMIPLSDGWCNSDRGTLTWAGGWTLRPRRGSGTHCMR